MTPELSVADVQAMAPDASAAAAAKKLANSARWRGLGRSARAFWGECQGGALYQTLVSSLDFAPSCSCPSRKVPCKHALALLFLVAASPSLVPEHAEPAWVSVWLSKREVAQRTKQARAEAGTKPPDLDARAKRATRRQENVLAGIDQLDIWLSDLLRRGLGRLQAEGPGLWDEQARRLVDAQAPGLASRVRNLGWLVGVRENWSERVLDELGMLALLTHAYRHLSVLPPELAHDVRRLVGFTLDQQEVVDWGDIVEDDWFVVSVRIDDDEHLRVQRAWLLGESSGRRAHVLQFAAGAAMFPDVLISASRFRARLAFWPSASPERALIHERLAGAEPAALSVPAQGIAAALDGHAELMSRNPWHQRTLFLLDAVRVVAGEPWHVVDAEGHALSLKGDGHDVVWALSGGHPITIAAEWNGYALEPLAAFCGSRTVSLPGEFSPSLP